MPMMFFHFLKIIFDISTSKRSKKYKPHSILAKKKIQNLMKRSYKRNAKRSLSIWGVLTCDKPLYPLFPSILDIFHNFIFLFFIMLIL
jgi:hypothetical protein